MKTFGDVYRKVEKIDWAAPGHYAEVYEARNAVGQHIAFKLMWAHFVTDPTVTEKTRRMKYEAYCIEAMLLKQFADHENVIDLYDCGYVETRQRGFPHKGRIVQFKNDIDQFVKYNERFMQEGWRPYLCVELFPEHQSLYVGLQEEFRENRPIRLPLHEGLALCLQYTRLLEHIHAQDVVYYDVKLPHYYWDGVRLTVIDWNSSHDLRNPREQFKDDAQDPAARKLEDIRAFILQLMYPIFTGYPWNLDTFEADPSDLKSVKKRVSQTADKLDFGMESAQGIPLRLQTIMQDGNKDKFKTAFALRVALEACAAELDWSLPPDSQQSDDQIVRFRKLALSGIQHIRDAQESLRLAKEALREATGVADNAEADRLYESANKFWLQRIIP